MLQCICVCVYVSVCAHTPLYIYLLYYQASKLHACFGTALPPTNPQPPKEYFDDILVVIGYPLYQIDQVIFDQIMILTVFYLLDTSFLSCIIKHLY